MTPESRADAIKRLNELDKARTQGVWKLCPHQHYGRTYTWAISAPDRYVCSAMETYALLGDGEFIAAAPDMLLLLNKQEELLKQVRCALKRYVETDETDLGDEENNAYYIKIHDDAVEALTLSDESLPWRGV